MLPIYEIRKSNLTVKRNKYALSFPEHMHKHIEIAYAYKGCQRITSDGESFTVDEGSAAVIFPETLHSYTGGSEGETEILILMCVPSIFGSLFPSISECKLQNPIIPAEEISDELRTAFRLITPEQKYEVAFSWSCVILSYIFETLTPTKRILPADTDLTYSIVKYIEESFTEDITRETLARKFNISECYVSRILAQKLNINLRNYLGILRSNYAAQLIRTTNESFTAIALLAGFGSTRSFNRMFKGSFGMTPKEYKQNISGLMND